MGTDCITDHGFETSVDVVTGGADFDGEHQCFSVWVSANEISDTLKCGQRTSAPVSDEESSLNVAVETHVCDKTTTHVRADVAGARTNSKEIYGLSR
ncbi:MAG TPA: hypothetical protein VFE61_01645 [Candidatus Sulfotelmatobacter sp.]|nr:hypothetical protein [Candidatus Sulfotelmatobacter sp.]